MKMISLREFLSHFPDQKREDKKFCFVLGSGASRQSGIPTGGELVKEWMKNIQDRSEEADYKKWLTDSDISESNPAKNYCKIYDKRFCLDLEDGFACLEDAMDGKDPSVGYSILAQILAEGRHRVVVTTNFDSLTEDALFIYTNKKPLVVGHETLANYIKPFGQRPVVIKIHRDLLLSPINDLKGTSQLAEGFSKNLETIFKHYTPLVIGYGGNDGSLMGFLEGLDEIKGGLFWFYREADSAPSARIQKLVEKFNGHFVPIEGFDELMIQLGDKLELERLDERIVEVAKSRSDAYRKQIEDVTQAKKADSDTKEALEGIVTRGKKSWWSYELAAQTAASAEEKDRIYNEGGNEFPGSSELKGNYANFLTDIRKDHDRAEKLYEEAIVLDPDNAPNKGNYANFLTDIRKDHDRAEILYEEAIALDPNHADYKGNYANFLTDIRKNHDRAAKLYEEAIALDPDNALNKGNYANFLTDIRKNHDRAAKLYEEAIALDPDNVLNKGNYANLLKNIRKDYDLAEKLYEEAIALDPDNALNKANYALFKIELGDFVKAEELIGEAFKHNTNPENETLSLELWFYRYAIFPEDYPESRQMIETYLSKGVQSLDWNLDGVLVRSKERKHQHYDELVEYARRITGHQTN